MTEDVDRRRRQWVPLATDFPWTRTIKMLAEKFGPEGPLLWMMVLAAAKRNLNQGQFQFLSESEGWAQLGWDEMGLERPDFTLETFFAYTGQIKRTRKRDRQHVQITSWERWNNEVRTRQKAEQKRRKRIGNTDAIADDMRPPDSDLDLDSERESEATRTTTPNGVVRSPTEKGYECELCGNAYATEQSVVDHIEIVHTDAERAQIADVHAAQARQQLERLAGKVKTNPNEIGIPF